MEARHLARLPSLREMLMGYRLRKGLSYCRIDGHAIFLDIESDRYFRLSDGIEAAFTAFIEGGRNSEAELAALTKYKILTTAPRIEGNDESSSMTPPTHSAFELSGPSGSLSLPTLLEVSTLVLATRWALKTRRLVDVMESLVCYRLKHAGQPQSLPKNSSTPLVCDAANSFNRARLYVPVATSCLLDSLSMAKFLARRQIDASVVFGVTRDPFAAHCWVQVGDTVLNDTVGNVTAHTPIRIV
jgi:hypothetical protein